MAEEIWTPKAKRDTRPPVTTPRKGSAARTVTEQTGADEEAIFVPPVVPLSPEEIRAAEQRELGYVNGECRYGCAGSESMHTPGIGWHHFACPYWDREGKGKTPF